MNYDPNEKLAKRSYRRDGHGQKEGGFEEREMGQNSQRREKKKTP
jgi:hypothetical protein